MTKPRGSHHIAPGLPEDLTGTTVGRFTAERPVDSGATGEVDAAYDPQ